MKVKRLLATTAIALGLLSGAASTGAKAYTRLCYWKAENGNPTPKGVDHPRGRPGSSINDKDCLTLYSGEVKAAIDHDICQVSAELPNDSEEPLSAQSGTFVSDGVGVVATVKFHKTTGRAKLSADEAKDYDLIVRRLRQAYDYNPNRGAMWSVKWVKEVNRAFCANGKD
jgi:hypothetical protein